MDYTKAHVYFLSGTGNSMRVARWFGQWAEGRGIDATVRPVDDADPRAEIADDADTLVGLVYPTHGFTAIWRAITFAARLPRVRRARAFCVATRAGSKIGSVFLPGIAATAPFLIALILGLRGYRVRGATGIDMPSNWTAVHPGFKESTARAIIERSRPRAQRFADRILSGGRSWLTWSNLWDAAWSVPLAYVALLYLLIGRFVLAKLFFATNRCTGCGLCAEECPVGALRMVGTRRPRPFWRWNCESCMRCMNFCPERAIEASQSWALVVYFVVSIPASTWLVALTAGRLPGVAGLNGTLVGRLVDFVSVYPAIFLSYYVFYALTRVPALNAVFARATLTRFWRRYREPDTKRNLLVRRSKTRNPA